MAQTATIGAIAVQISRIATEQADLRSLVMDVLKEMLRISAMQAEATVTMLRIAEEQQKQIAFQAGVGPGTSRDTSEEADFIAWRQQLADEREARIGRPTELDRDL